MVVKRDVGLLTAISGLGGLPQRSAVYPDLGGGSAEHRMEAACIAFQRSWRADPRPTMPTKSGSSQTCADPSNRDPLPQISLIGMWTSNHCGAPESLVFGLPEPPLQLYSVFLCLARAQNLAPSARGRGSRCAESM